MIQFTGEKMAKSVGNIALLHEVLDQYGREAVVMYLVSGHYRQPLAFSQAALEQAQANVRRIREAGRRLSPGASPSELEPLRDRFFDALARDFNTAEALAVLNEWLGQATSPLWDSPGDAHLREMLAVLGLESLLAPVEQAPEDVRGAGRAARAGTRRARLRRRRQAARRDRGARLGGPRRAERLRADPVVILYGRNPVSEALRGRRAGSVRDVWATAGAAREPWLAGVPVRTVGAEEIERRCGSEAHQGLCADAGPYHYASAEELLSVQEPLLVVLDQIQDPQNLGSICRTAECAGAAGVVIPERRAAEVTAAVCKASAGAVEHLPVARVRNLADFLADARSGRLLVLRRERRGRARLRSAGRAGAEPGAGPLRHARLQRLGRRPGARQRGRRPAPARGGGVRSADRAAAAREDRVARRQRGRGGASVRDLAKPQFADLTRFHNCVRLRRHNAEPKVEKSLGKAQSHSFGARGGVRH